MLFRSLAKYEKFMIFKSLSYQWSDVTGTEIYEIGSLPPTARKWDAWYSCLSTPLFSFSFLASVTLSFPIFMPLSLSSPFRGYHSVSPILFPSQFPVPPFAFSRFISSSSCPPLPLYSAGVESWAEPQPKSNYVYLFIKAGRRQCVLNDTRKKLVKRCGNY